MFDRQGTSWLRHARAVDTDAYRAARDAGVLTKGKPKTETYEMGVLEQQVAAIYELMQQAIHLTARQPGHAKTRPWPTPVTAEDLVTAQDNRESYDALMADISFVPREQFDALMAEHGDQTIAVSDK